MKKRPDLKKNPKHQRLLDAARSLFLKNGLLATGIDEIARTSGLSKRTVYKFYDNREALSAAVILHDYDCWHEWFFDAVAERTRTADSALAAFYEVFRLWTGAPEYHGCLFARVLLAGDMMSEQAFLAAKSCLDRLQPFFLEQARKEGPKNKDAFVRSQVIYVLMLLGGAYRSLEGAPREHLIQDVQSLFKKR